MDDHNAKRMAATVTFILGSLAKSQFSELVKTSRLSALDLRTAIAEYGIKIATPSLITADELNIVEIMDTNPQEWSVNYDLIDRIQGPSDLTLQLTLIENQQQLMAFMIDDIHVL